MFCEARIGERPKGNLQYLTYEWISHIRPDESIYRSPKPKKDTKSKQALLSQNLNICVVRVRRIEEASRSGIHLEKGEFLVEVQRNIIYRTEARSKYR